MNSRHGVTATADMAVLLAELLALRAGSRASSGVPSARELVLSVAKEDKLTLRRTVKVRFGFDLGFRILDLGFLTTNVDIRLNSSDFAIGSLVLTSFSANFLSAFLNPHSAIVDPVAQPSSRSRDCNS